MAGPFYNRAFGWSHTLFAFALLTSAATAWCASPVRVGFVTCAPLCQPGAQGRPAGLVFDLLDSMDTGKGSNFVVEEIPLTATLSDVEAKSFDVVVAADREPEMSKAFASSVAYVSLPSAVFVRSEDGRLSTFESLRGRRIGVVEKSSEASYAATHRLTSQLIEFRSPLEALAALSGGDCDAVLCETLVASKLTHDHALANIRASELSLPDLRTPLHLFVPRSNPGLLEAINDGVVRLYASGRYEKIHEKWLGPMETKRFYIRDFLPYLLPVTALLFLLFVALAWQRQMLAASYKELRASEFFYHSLVESLPQIIVRKNSEGKYTYANSAFGELIGKPLSEIVGRMDADLIEPAAAAKGRAEDIRVMDTKCTAEYEHVVELAGGRRRYLQVKKVPLFDNAGGSLGVQVLYWDVTVFRETEQQLRQAQKELIEASRRAGMAEVAVNVLHNIGNCLNSVNVASATAMEQVQRLKFSVLQKISDLLREHRQDLGAFFSSDARAQRLPEVFPQIVEEFTATREAAVRELQVLRDGVDKIGEIVAAQQEYTRFAGVRESVAPKELMESALSVCEAALTKNAIRVLCDWREVPSVDIERQKAVQVLVNLLSNAQDAVNEANPAEKIIRVRTDVSSAGVALLSIEDNGVGIPAENLTRIYALGFTTKKDGRGFGLHSGALAAKEMGGALRAFSGGPGQGATFILELPSAARPAAGSPANAAAKDRS